MDSLCAREELAIQRPPKSLKYQAEKKTSKSAEMKHKSKHMNSLSSHAHTEQKKLESI